jgi:hypothetical protein
MPMRGTRGREASTEQTYAVPRLRSVLLQVSRSAQAAQVWTIDMQILSAVLQVWRSWISSMPTLC